MLRKALHSGAPISTLHTLVGERERELVALVCGGHLYGRCHPEHSGYAGPWIEDMTHWSNEYAADLVGDPFAAVATKDCVNTPGAGMTLENCNTPPPMSTRILQLFI